MANEECPKCGTEMVWKFEGIMPDGRRCESRACPLDPKDCRIAELEKQVAELEAEIEACGPVAVTKHMTPEGERIVELERQLEEAKLTVYQREVRIETMDAENNRLWNQKNSALSERDEALTALREMAESATAERNACSEKQCEIGRLSAQLRASQAREWELRQKLFRSDCNAMGEGWGHTLCAEQRDAAEAQVKSLTAALEGADAEIVYCFRAWEIHGLVHSAVPSRDAYNAALARQSQRAANAAKEDRDAE